jgi:dTDP-4-dehydrorhamnose reductase
MRILVTGASGLLGANLALEAAKDHIVFGLVNSLELHTDAFQVLKGNLAEPGVIEYLLDHTQPEWVIHCAALANVDACEADPARAVQLNTEVPRKLAMHVARGGARLLHVSTDAVFDGVKGDYSESDVPNPLSVYARTKLEGEHAVTDADPEAIIARVNLFGWSPSGKRSLAEWFFNNLSTDRSVMGFTDVFFCPLLANELGRIFLELLQKQLHGLYHVVAQDCLSKYDFGVQLANLFGLDAGLIRPTSVQNSGLAAARSPNLTLQTTKITPELGHPPSSIHEGLQKFYELYLQKFPLKLREML